jgi:SAM-dependent methyltransferase
MNRYRRAVWQIFQSVLAPVGPLSRVLDFCSGDGWFALQFRQCGQVGELVPMDVQRRDHELVEPVLYDGARLPCVDGEFEMVYSVDVLHHCPEPRDSLREALRCTNKWFLLKDHTYHKRLGYWFMCLLDEIGNRRFGVPCRYKHQHDWEWFETLKAEGFVLERLVHPAGCHTGLMRFVNRFEFVSLWRREKA